MNKPERLKLQRPKYIKPGFQEKIRTYAKRHTQLKETQQAAEPDSDMAAVLGAQHYGFKVINLLRDLMEKTANIQDQMDNISRETETLRIETKTEMKNSFNGLSNRLDKERDKEFQEISIETSKVEIQRGKNLKRQKEYPKAVELFEMMRYTCLGHQRERKGLPHRMNAKGSASGHSILKVQKIKDKQNILKEVREENQNKIKTLPKQEEEYKLYGTSAQKPCKQEERGVKY